MFGIGLLTLGTFDKCVSSLYFGVYLMIKRIDTYDLLESVWNWFVNLGYI